MDRTITMIQAVQPILIEERRDPILKRKVAAYARVSTDKDEQFTSYQSQIDYYTKFIQTHSEWEFVKVYTDEGVTGTCIKLRHGFQEMISDALNGKIDLIVTKSISRFARNTVDSLTMIRKLKENGCEVYFEKENIFTFDSKGELLITIMSSIAQEESRSISENVTWGIRKRMADGKYCMHYSEFLGYIEGPSGEPIVDPLEAIIVRRIFLMCFEKMSPFAIAKELTKEKIPTPAGKENWHANVIKSILKNEKYTGDALLQKTYSVSFLTKKRKPNDGELKQYYVKNGHEAIIEKDTLEKASEILPLIPKPRFCENDVPYSKRIRCGKCGNWYSRTLWHPGKYYEKLIWRCNMKGNSKSCHNQNLEENDIVELYGLCRTFLKTRLDILISSLKVFALSEEQISAIQEEKEEIQIYMMALGIKTGKKRISELEKLLEKDIELKNVISKIEEKMKDENVKFMVPKKYLNMAIDYFIIESKTSKFVVFCNGEKHELVYSSQ